MLVLALYLSGYLISFIWEQLMLGTIVTMIPDRIHSSSMPFPAVTICNSNVARKSVIERMAPHSWEHMIAEHQCRDGFSLNVSATYRSMYNVAKKVKEIDIAAYKISKNVKDFL